MVIFIVQFCLVIVYISNCTIYSAVISRVANLSDFPLDVADFNLIYLPIYRFGGLNPLNSSGLLVLRPMH